MLTGHLPFLNLVSHRYQSWMVLGVALQGLLCWKPVFLTQDSSLSSCGLHFQRLSLTHPKLTHQATEYEIGHDRSILEHWFKAKLMECKENVRLYCTVKYKNGYLFSHFTKQNFIWELSGGVKFEGLSKTRHRDFTNCCCTDWALGEWLC